MKKRDFLKKLLTLVPAPFIANKVLSHQELADKLMKETKEQEERQRRTELYNYNASGSSGRYYFNVSG